MKKSRSSRARKQQFTLIANEATKAAKKIAGAKGDKELGRKVRAQLARELNNSAALTGRPPVVVDVEQLKKMARIHCTYKEIADVLGCSVATLRKRFRSLIKRERSRGKRSLRRAQFNSALKQKNPIMQIWLGKNVLKQADKVEHTGRGGGPIKMQSATLLLIGKLDQIEKRRGAIEKSNDDADEVQDVEFEEVDSELEEAS